MHVQQVRLHSRKPFSSLLVPALVLCLTAFGERTLFALVEAPQPRVTLNVPSQVLIGDTFTFTVTFRNDRLVPGVLTGYGAFIDVVFDAGGANLLKPQPCPCDGISFVQANVVGVNGAAAPLVSYPPTVPSGNPCPLSKSPVAVTHAFDSSGVKRVLLPAGGQLVTIELPFGSFDATQPEITVQVTAKVSENAEGGYPLEIFARGGFRYGADALDNPNIDCPVLSDTNTNPVGPPCTNQVTDSTLWHQQGVITPTVMIIGKKYLGPESENATGPNLTTYYPLQYAITVSIAPGQTVTGLTLSDTIPLNMVFDRVVSLSPASGVSTPPSSSFPLGPGGAWTIRWPSITGGQTHPDATAYVAFHVPRLDAAGALVLPADCGDVHSINTVQASYAWMPTDSCDWPAFPTSTATDDLLDKCLAIQKSVAVAVDTGAPGPTPGDTLEYTLRFQVSDFRNVGDIRIEDVISDGQTLLTSPSPTLTFTDQCGTTSAPIPIPAGDWPYVDQCPTGAPFSQLPSRTTVDFDVSAAMIAANHSGVLRGGFTTTPSSSIPGTGEIRFRTVIDDTYHCQIVDPPHDAYVDKDDPLSDRVTITGRIYDDKPRCSDIPAPTSAAATDVSGSAIAIVADVLEKTVYAVNRPSLGHEICGPNTFPPTLCTAPDVMPGDQVTFRLRKTIPSGDAEALTIQDWLPLPVFHVQSGFSLSNTPCNGPPPSGTACQVSLPTWVGPPLTLLPPPDPVTNSITFKYGSFHDTNNQPGTIDLLFTFTASNDPFADGLYITNEAWECENNTFVSDLCKSAIAQIHVREPALTITKGVVAASNPNAAFSPPPVAFNAPGGTACPRFSGVINSTNLSAVPINSNVSNVDANDCVTFAIVVENKGGAPAYDIELRDIFPLDQFGGLDCFNPNFDSLCVTDGTGANIQFSRDSGGGSVAIVLSSPLPGVNAPPGSNIAVITFDACVIGNIKPHCCNNTGAVENYASTPNGPNFVHANFGGPFQDSAQLCVLPKATKSIKTTSEALTPGTPSGPPVSPEQLAIGEIVRYRLEVVVPESSSPSNYTLTDSFPTGLRLFNINTPTVAFVSNGSGIASSTFGTSPRVDGNELKLATITPTFDLPQSAISPGSFACGDSPSFNLGDLINSDNDSDQEFIVVEFNAVVCNIPSNQHGTALKNSFGVVVNGSQVATSNSVTAVVVEPNLVITKAVTVPSLIANATATYTITLKNNRTATALDVRLTDQLPACLANLTNIHVDTAATDHSTTTMLDLTIASIPVNGTVTITYTATVSCLDCSKLVNTARVTWTSLPGPRGTLNNPTSSISGGPGLPGGERDGSGGVNDYVASATASLCCLPVSKETLSCDSNGTFAYTLTVTNLTSSTISGILFLQSSPANVTITPSEIAATLIPGASKTLTVTIGGPGAVSGVPVCFTVATGAAAISCRIPHCVTLPNCCVQPPSGMVAWWPLDETSGTFVADIAGDNNGTAIPGPIGVNGEPRSFPGKVNHAMALCSAQGPSFVSVPDNQVLDFGTAQSFSIDAWILARNAVIVDKLTSSNLSSGYRFYSLHTLKLDIGSGAFTGTTALGADVAWRHIAVTVDRGLSLVTFYINGQPEVAAGNPSSLNASSPGLDLQIGGTNNAQLPSGCENGVDEVEIFDRALSQAEVQSIFNAGSAGKCKCVSPPPGMVGWWPGDSNANDIAGGNDGTLQGDATFARGMVLSAFSFAAVNDYVSVPSAANLNFGPAGSGGDLSIDAWIETSSTAANLAIVDKRDLPVDQSIGYTLFLYDGKLGFQLGDGTFFNYISETPDLRDGKFHHVAVTVDRTSHTGGTLYADGNVVLQFDPTNRPASLINDKPLLIGQHAAEPSKHFVGLIDEVEIFNRRLSKAEIEDIVSSGPAGKCTSAVICVTTFWDSNFNGVQDSGEPEFFFGVTFTVTDQNGTPVGTITAPGCLTVPRPGNYTIREQVPPGFAPTQANPQTVTIVPGGFVTLGFGHRRGRGRAVRH